MSTRTFINLTIVLACVAPACGASGRPTVAVSDFTVGHAVAGQIVVEHGQGPGQVTTLSVKSETSLLTDKLIAALSRSEKITVVEREKLDLLLKEKGLTDADLTDPAKSFQARRIQVADYYLLGSLSLLDGRIEYHELPYNLGQRRTMQLVVGADIRIMETSTGKILDARSQKVKWTRTETNPADTGNRIPVEFQHEAYDELVGKLVADVVDALFPIKVAAAAGSTAYLNRAGLVPGTKYRVIQLGDTIYDPDLGADLGRTEVLLATVVVKEGLEKFSTAEVCEWLVESRELPKGSLCRLLQSEPNPTVAPRP